MAARAFPPSMHYQGLNAPVRMEVDIRDLVVEGEIPAEIVAETPNAFVIRDIAPQAPVHLLVVPKTPQYRTVVELAEGDPALLAEIVALAGRMAREHADGDFRLVFNTGPGAAPERETPGRPQLTEDEAVQHTRETYLGGADDWAPWG